MWIKKIKLTNVGVYIGDNVFEFDDKKTFNIISGENGNGKTTFLTALTIGLYGCEAYGSSKYTNEYIERVQALYSRNSSSDEMIIDISFNHNNLNYQFIRKYQFKGSKFIEDEQIYINDNFQKSFSMNKIMNKSFFEFFFFDGESILEVINNNKIVNYVNTFIDVAYEFDVFKTLKKDLLKTNRKIINQVATDDIKLKRRDLNTLSKKIKNNENEMINIKKELLISTTNLDKIKADIKKLGFLKRDDIAKKITLQENIKQELIKIDNHATRLLKNDINVHLHQKLLINTYTDLEKTRKKRLDLVIKAYTNLDCDYDLDIPLDVEKTIYNNVHNYNKDTPYNLIDEYKQTNKQYLKLKKAIATVDDGIMYNSYMDNYELFEQRIAALKLLEVKLHKNANELNNDYNTLLKVINDLEKKLLKNTLEANAIKVNDKTIKVIDQYLNTKRKEVVNKIEDEVILILNHSLMRKKDYIEKIKILEDEIVLYSKHHKEDILHISSGEKQVLIVALSLAIIKTASVNNALVLDTFIGRLDTTHTKNLLKFMAQDLDNQIIILTTSSEISDKERAYIKHDIASEYLLDYDNSKTKVIRRKNAN